LAGKTLTGAIISSGAVVKTVGKALAGALALAGSLLKALLGGGAPVTVTLKAASVTDATLSEVAVIDASLTATEQTVVSVQADLGG
jgi:hypothetical protein